jgi:COP9 signalosome complex subunit 4
MDIQMAISALNAETLSADEATQKYKDLCDSLIGSQLADQAQTLLDHLITGNVPKTVTSPSLNYLTEEIKKIKSNDELKTLCRYGVEKFRQFPNAFDRAEANLKDCLADLYIDEDEYLKAASILAEIDLERGSFDALYKATINVRIAEFFAHDSIGMVHKADTFIKKARPHMKEVTETEISLRYALLN